MRTAKQLFCTGTIAVSLLSFCFTPVAEAATPASRFLQEEAFCFQQGTPLPGGWNVYYKLSASPLSGGGKNQIVGVHALERGTQVTNQVNSYLNQLVGTATLSASNTGVSGGDVIHVSLVGTSFGTNEGANTGLWNISLNLQLNKSSLNGRILGIKQFTPIANGTATAAPVFLYVDETITLMDSCPNGL